MTEQHTAPASAKREYRANPLSFAGDWALASWMAASTLGRPVVEGGGEVVISKLDVRLEDKVDDYYFCTAICPRKKLRASTFGREPCREKSRYCSWHRRFTEIESWLPTIRYTLTNPGIIVNSYQNANVDLYVNTPLLQQTLDGSLFSGVILLVRYIKS